MHISSLMPISSLRHIDSTAASKDATNSTRTRFLCGNGRVPMHLFLLHLILALSTRLIHTAKRSTYVMYYDVNFKFKFGQPVLLGGTGRLLQF